MDALQWRRLNDLFHSAMDRAAGERRAWLERACAGDAALAAQVERLVRAHERASSFIRTEDSPAHRLAADNRALAREFVGTERFAVRQTLGVGGMGVVYEVHDRARNEIVALKTLLHARPDDLLRLKREFRSLANVAHVNLVSLYELFADDEQCFFTMELVDGVNFVDAARLLGARSDRLRTLLAQLVDGVSELHRLGKRHRDIKPSNVRVARDGRVVILDFGLVADTADRITALDDRIAGTPAYMSPEQATGAPACEESDWVTLYEALTGKLPFPGTFGHALGAKLERDPSAPGEVSSDVQEDLSAICMDLLCRDPRRRINGVDAIRQFSGNPPVTIAVKTRADPAPFVGREWHLGVLRESFEASREGRSAAVHVCGPSGIGKSALVRQFLDRLQGGDEVVVLSGRCYENESIPYKALDGVVDNLSHYLASMSPESAAALVPPDVTALARLFPVLDRVASAPDREADPVRLRRRAFGALRELFARIARRRPLVLFIDDLDWADADSALLLEELLRPPDPPPLLLLSCFRTEEMDGKPFLRTLLAGGAVPLPLAPLTDAESRELIATALPGGSPVTSDDATRLVREAEGNPILLEQMAQYVALPRAPAAHAPTLDEMLDERLHGLPAGAREFLTTLAICGRPMTASLVGEASGLTGDERRVVTTLRSTNFVRTSGALDRVEIYHDRIRETVAARLDSETLRRVHRRLADTLTARRIDDPEALFEHWRGAGDDARASAQGVAAARKASAALAFDRAAMFYRHALDLAQDARHPDWKEGLATALANAGRPADAATVYLQAAEDAHSGQRLELQRKSAEQSLTAGHVDRGVEVVRTVLAAAGMRFPRGPRQALASLLVRRARLRWRGLTFSERRQDVIAPDVLLRIDTCWSVMTGMAMVDNVRAWDFGSRHLLAALEAGEPYRIARGFAAEAAFYGTRGGAGHRYAAEVARMADQLSERIGHPHAIAFTTMTAGMTAMMSGEWQRAARLCERALTLLQETCVGVTWELSSAQTFLLGALLYQGELQDVARRLTPALATAKDRGNLYVEAELRTRVMSLVLLAADQPLEAERQAQDVMQRWWRGGFTRQHYSHLLGRATTALYRGDGEAAWKLVAENRATVSRTLLLRIQIVRIEMSFLRGRCALAAASVARDPSARRRLLSVASGESRRIAREKMPWSDGFARLLKATVASQTGDGRTAEQQLAAAVDAFDRAGMGLYAAGARRRLGLFQGGRGRPLVVAAEEWMARQGVVNPQFMTRMVAPGFREP